MAIEVTIETTIARPPAEVFGQIADIAAWPAWLIASGIVAVTRSADGPITVGERLRIDQRAAGRAGTFDAEVTVVEPPRHLGLRGEDGNGVSIDIEAVLAPCETGTVLTWSIRIGLPARFRFFESMARPQVQRAAALDLEALRLRLESTPAA